MHAVFGGLRLGDETLKPWLTNADLAKKYAISVRTVTNWRREGCPFDEGQWRVLDWMAERRYVPATAKTKFARQLERRNPAPDDPRVVARRLKALCKQIPTLQRLDRLRCAG